MRGKRYISWIIGITILAGTGWSFWTKRQQKMAEAIKNTPAKPAVVAPPLETKIEVQNASLSEEKVEVLELNLSVNQRFPMIKTVE